MHAKGLKWVLILFAILAVAACSTTKKDVDKWAGAVGGEVELAKFVADSKVDMDVRSYAAVTMIKIGKFENLVGTIKALPVEERGKLISSTGPDIGKLFEVPDMKIQAAAKDALYMLMQLDDKHLADSSKQAILKWYSVNFPKKYAAGKFSAFNVLTDIGPASADVLVKVMEQDTNMRVKVAKIMEKINDPGLNKKASDLFLKWMKEQKPNYSPELLQILCFVRDDRVTEELNAYIIDKNNPIKVRINAYNTLTFHPSKLSLPASYNILIDRKEDIDMRGIALEIIKAVGDAGALKYLEPYLKDEDIKWGVFGAIAKIGGAKEMGKVLKSMSGRVTFWRDDYEIARRNMKDLDASAAEELIPFLKDKDIPIVALALIGLQYTANKEQADKYVQPMVRDQRVIKNYVEGKDFKIGLLAKQVHDQIIKRTVDNKK